MHVPRRDVLKGLIFTGASSAIAGSVSIWLSPSETYTPSAQAARPVHILIGSSSQSPAFLNGINRSAHQLGVEPSIVHLRGSLIEDVTQAERALRSRQPLIALLDPADGILLQDLARGHGLRVAFLGQHTLGGSNWQQRHHLTTLPQSAGLGLALQIGLDNQNSLVTETPLGHTASISTPMAVAGTTSRPWADLLSEALMQVACGSWRPEASGPHAVHSRGDADAGLPESLTSIVIHG